MKQVPWGNAISWLQRLQVLVDGNWNPESSAPPDRHPSANDGRSGGYEVRRTVPQSLWGD